MNAAIWNCTYGDELWYYIQQVEPYTRRKRFEGVFERFGEFTLRTNEILTLREYMNMYEREKKDN